MRRWRRAAGLAARRGRRAAELLTDEAELGAAARKRHAGHGAEGLERRVQRDGTRRRRLRWGVRCLAALRASLQTWRGPVVWEVQERILRRDEEISRRAMMVS